MGSGFGSNRGWTGFLPRFPNLFSMAAAGSLKIAVDPIPLPDVEAAWSARGKGRTDCFYGFRRGLKRDENREHHPSGVFSLACKAFWAASRRSRFELKSVLDGQNRGLMH